MNNIQKRFLLFIFGCITIRSILTYIAKNSSPDLLQKMGILGLIPVLGWIYIMLIGQRDTGPEVFGEKIWWKDIRIIHAMFWWTFAYMAMNKNKHAWIALGSDTAFGFLAFLIHHYNSGSLNLLL